MKLYNGDCLDVLKTFEDKSIDTVITSPPYNSGKSRTTKSKLKGKYEHFEDSNKNYYDWCVSIIDELFRVTNKYIIWNIQTNYYNKKDVYKLIGNYSEYLQQNVIWYKPNGTPSSTQHRLSNVYEFILIFTKQKSVLVNPHHLTNHIELNIYSKRNKIHSAVMPSQLSNFLVSNFTKENETILDCFMGIGTTGVSCKKMNREFVGIELVKEYYDIAVDNINNTQEGLF